MDHNWLTQQLNTMAKNGNWYSVHSKFFQYNLKTIYVSRRAFKYHINSCVLNDFTVDCIYPWDYINK